MLLVRRVNRRWCRLAGILIVHAALLLLLSAFVAKFVVRIHKVNSFIEDIDMIKPGDFFEQFWFSDLKNTNATLDMINGDAYTSNYNVSDNGISPTSSKRRHVYRPATSLRIFAPILSDQQRQVLFDSVAALVQTLDQFNISYHMCGGTLLGSFMHHGLIPWDDDVDLCVAQRDYLRLIVALDTATSSRFSYVLPSRQKRLKFFSKTGSRAITRKGVTWQAPFVDICLYDEDDTTIWDMSMGPPNENPKRFAKATVFPLGRRPFMNMSLRAPRHTHAYLAHNYRLDLCVTNRWSHILETRGRERAVRCRFLWPLHPFVFQTRLENGTILETLRRGNDVLGSVVVDEMGSLML